MGLIRTIDLKLASEIADGAVTLAKLPDGVLTADAPGRLKMANNFVVDAKVDAAAAIALSKMATDLTNVMLGLGAGYRIARGTVVVTGTEVVATGLTAIVAAVAIPRADPVATDMWASCTWAGANLTLKLWKPTSANGATANVAPIAATGGLQVDWIAIGT